MATFSDDIQAITREDLLPQVMDNVLSDNVIVARSMRNAKNWKAITNGKAVRLTKTTNGGSFSGLDEFDTSVQETKKKAYFDPRFYEKSVVLQGQDIDINAASNGSIDLVIEALEEAEEDMKDEIADLLYSDGTGNSNKDFLGLAAGIDDGSTVATYGGISRTTYSNWQGTVTNVGGALTQAVMAAAYDAAESGSQRPTIILTTPTQWTAYEALQTSTIQNNRMYVGSKGGAKSAGMVGDLGFETLLFRNTPVVKDEKCPSGEMIFLNEKLYAFYSLKSSTPEYETLKFKKPKQLVTAGSEISPNLAISWRPLRSAEKQYAVLGFIIIAGNYITYKPSAHAKLTSLS